MAGTSSGTAVVTVPSDTQILSTREFAAPRQLVYRAYTEPDLIRRWWGGDQGEVTVAEVDLRVGSRWRYVLGANGGVAFHGEYREIVPDERLVYTEVFDGMPDSEAVDTVSFGERDGGTALSVLVQHSCREHRDMHVDSGMEVGLQEAMDHLERVAASLR